MGNRASRVKRNQIMSTSEDNHDDDEEENESSTSLPPTKRLKQISKEEKDTDDEETDGSISNNDDYGLEILALVAAQATPISLPRSSSSSSRDSVPEMEANTAATNQDVSVTIG